MASRPGICHHSAPVLLQNFFLQPTRKTSIISLGLHFSVPAPSGSLCPPLKSCNWNALWGQKIPYTAKERNGIPWYPVANKQSSSGTAKPGCSFCLPPDSHLCFILVAELKQRGAELQPLVLQGMFQSHCHPAVTLYFGGGSVTPSVVAVAGSAQSQVLVLW